MIANPTEGKFLKGVIYYNEKKVAKGEAELLYINNSTGSIRTFNYQYHTLSLGKEEHDTVMHLSLNFHADDISKLTPEFLKQITIEFLKAYNVPLDHPYTSYRHFDKEHPHIHIILPLYTDSGKRIRTHKSILEFKKICRNLEEKYGLVNADGKKQQTDRVNTITELLNDADSESTSDKLNVNTKEFKTSFQAAEYTIRQALQSRPSSFKEFEKYLNRTEISYNRINCHIGYELNKKRNGITFFPAIKNPFRSTNEQITKGIKGKKINGLSYPKLSTIIEKNSLLKGKRANSIKHSINSTLESSILKTAANSFNSFNRELLNKKIKATYFYAKNNQIFGVEFRDLITGITYKGSEVDDNYSWNKLKLNFKEKEYIRSESSQEDKKTEKKNTISLIIPELQALNIHFENLEGILVSDVDGSDSHKEITINIEKYLNGAQFNIYKYLNTLTENILQEEEDLNPNLEKLKVILNTISEKTEYNKPIEQEQANLLTETTEKTLKVIQDLKSIKLNDKNMTLKERGDELKKNINVLEVAESLGYTIKSGSRIGAKYITMKRNDDDNIVLCKNSDTYDTYFNPLNQVTDKGDIINLLINKHNNISDYKSAIHHLEQFSGSFAYTNTDESKKKEQEKPFRKISNLKTPTNIDYEVKGHDLSIEMLTKLFPEYIGSIDHETLQGELKKLYGPDGAAANLPNIKPQYNYNVYPLFNTSRPGSREIIGQEITNKGYKHLVQGTKKTDGAWFIESSKATNMLVAESPSKCLAYISLNNTRTTAPFATMGNASNNIIRYLASLSAIGTNLILGGDNDAKGQYFNFRIACAIANDLSNTPINPILTYPDKGEKKFTLSLGNESMDKGKLNKQMNIENLKRLSANSGAVLSDEDNKLKLSIALTGDEKADSQKMASLLSEFIYIYKVNAKIAIPKLKDFNDDLKALKRPIISTRPKIQ